MFQLFKAIVIAVNCKMLSLNVLGRSVYSLKYKHFNSFWFLSTYRVLKAAKNALPLPLTSNLQLSDGEIVLDVDGNIPIQPVLQHIGISAWPGE